MVTEMIPIISSVVAALRDFGFWKAGTPLLIASTPVSAAAPCEKARITRNTKASPATCEWSGAICTEALSARISCPSTSARNSPTAIMPSTPMRNAYTGTASTPPDSRSPRRLIAVSTAIAATANHTLCVATNGISAPMFAAAEEIDTATVST